MLNFVDGRVPTAPSRADRDIPVASKGHCTAFAALGDGSGGTACFQAESHLELCHLMFLRGLPEVVDLREQVRFDYGHQNEATHFFDIFAVFRDGTRVAYTVKPTVRLRSGRFLEEMQVVAHWVKRKRFADNVCLLTDRDLDQVQRHNAKILSAPIAPDPDAECAVRDIAKGLRGAVSIREVVLATGLEERAHRAALSLIRAGELVLAKHERITPTALVTWKGSQK